MSVVKQVDLCESGSVIHDSNKLEDQCSASISNISIKQEDLCGWGSQFSEDQCTTSHTDIRTSEYHSDFDTGRIIKEEASSDIELYSSQTIIPNWVHDVKQCCAKTHFHWIKTNKKHGKN